jgi:hypothetical protein
LSRRSLGEEGWRCKWRELDGCNAKRFAKRFIPIIPGHGASQGAARPPRPTHPGLDEFDLSRLIKMLFDDAGVHNIRVDFANDDLGKVKARRWGKEGRYPIALVHGGTMGSASPSLIRRR